jgi:hypothetical protein
VAALAASSRGKSQFGYCTMPPFAQEGRTHEELAPIGVGGGGGGGGGGNGLAAQARTAHLCVATNILYIILIQPLLPSFLPSFLPPYPKRTNLSQ